MPVLIYNTASKEKEKLVPIREGKISMFVCGQTPYDDAHLGHAKTYINFDVVARWLRHRGYAVTYIQNITDIEDKIIKRAEEQGVKPIELARRYEKLLFEDMDRIGVRKGVTEYPRSHDYITQIRDQIQLLVDRGYAYELDGDVYFDVLKFSDYTKISGMKLEDLKKHRIEPKEGKRNPFDFALWKAAKPSDDAQWEIVLKFSGNEKRLSGRPGWHIEDTAIAHHFFGAQYDIHGGAIELIFPHHTNEIAQAEAAYGIKPYVRYWMHSGVLNIKGVKMSKSLKNFIKIRDIIDRYPPEALRLMVCTAHYRSEIEYSEDLMKEALRRLAYIRAAVGSIYNMNEAEGASGPVGLGAQFQRFEEAMDDDFNTPMALAALYEAAAKMRAFSENNNSISATSKEEAVSGFVGTAHILGLLEDESYKKGIPVEARRLISERERLRAKKLFSEADKIRTALQKGYNITLEDTSYGTVWYR
jgi:cysteinyl-tRNA synthetase